MILPSSLVCSLLLLLLLAAAPRETLAQMVITRPLARGFGWDKIKTAPCGGFDTPVKPAPLSTTNPDLYMASFSTYGSWTANIKLSTDSSFTTIATGGLPMFFVAPDLPFTFSLSYPDFTKVKGIANDSAAVLQVILQSGSNLYYQCSDVIINPSQMLPPRTDSGLETIPSTDPGSWTPSNGPVTHNAAPTSFSAPGGVSNTFAPGFTSGRTGTLTGPTGAATKIGGGGALTSALGVKPSGARSVKNVKNGQGCWVGVAIVGMATLMVCLESFFY
ncbi:hypothetical protein HDU97_005822 [Phlyctochytrium planicorne]|nr:hypothetical protein HDU97_005822 [Phlyctochytrium planicorne]